MVLTIYDRAGNPRAELSPNDSSTQAKKIQGDNVLTLSFILYEHVELDVDDYVDFEGERYWLTEQYRPKQVSTKEWRYDLKLYGIESLLRNLLVIKTVDDENDPVFSLTAPPREHVAMIVKCMNDGMGNITDWKVGQVDGTENIVIDYHGKYCDEALKEIAEKVGAEWWTEGQTVNVCRCEHGESVTLGYNKGLTSIDPGKADNVKFYTRLWPVGSSRNIDPEKYGYTRLQLPGGQKYVEVNADKYGRVDHYEDAAFADIYPRRIGTVSSVRSEVKKGEDGKDFTIYYFKDYSLTFNPNDYMIGGKVFRVSFQQGSELGGLGDEEDGTYYFEVNYNADTREFEIITIWPYDNDVQLPGGTLVPKLGDKYILWNLRMPDEYYRLAEAEFLEAVNKYNDEHALDISVFKASTDHVWIEDQSAELFVGRRVRLESDRYFPGAGYRDSRITRITRKVNLPSQMDIEIGDALGRTSKVKFADDISSVRSYAQSIAGSISLPDIVRTGDRTRLTDNNLMSALRIDKSYLSKVKDDRSAHRISTDMAFEVGRYIAGASGGIFGMDVNGDSFAEVARLYVRVKAFFEELTVIKAGVIAGKQYITPGGGVKCTRVEELEGAYRCYFLVEQDGDKIASRFEAGDQAISEAFNAKEGVANDIANHRYWRLVTGVDNEGYTDDNGNRYGSIDLSKTDCEADSGVPHVGDEICQFGNRNNPLRQTAMVFSTVEADSPSLKMFSGINGYALTDKAVISFGQDALTSEVYFRLGNAEAKQYLQYTQSDGLTVAGTISTQSVFDDGQGNRRGVAEYVEKVAGGVFGTLATRNIALQSGEWGLDDCTFEKFSDVGLTKWNTWMEPCGLSIVGGGLRIERTGELTHGATEQLSVNDLEEGQTVTLRLRGKVEGLTGEPSAVVVELLNLDEENLHYAVWFAQITENGDVDLTRTMKVGARMKDARLMFNMAYADIGASITIKEVGLYLGDRIPELWEAAPEDTGYLRKALREAVADSTELTGGMVLSTMLLLGTTDADGVRDVQSGISGVNDASGGTAPAIWMGGNPFGGAEPTALFRHNGTGYMASGVIEFLLNAIRLGGGLQLDASGMKLLDADGTAKMRISNEPLEYTNVEAVESEVSQLAPVALTQNITIGRREQVTMPNGMVKLGGMAVTAGAEWSGISLGTLTAKTVVSGTVTVELGVNTGSEKMPFSGLFNVYIYSLTDGLRNIVYSGSRSFIDKPSVGRGVLTFNAVIPTEGEYYIAVVIPTTTRPLDYWGTASNHSIAPVINLKVTRGIAEQFAIASDGVLGVWTGLKWLAKANYFGVLAGSNYGLRMQPDGIYLRLGSETWRKLALSGSNLVLK